MRRKAISNDKEAVAWCRKYNLTVDFYPGEIQKTTFVRNPWFWVHTPGIPPVSGRTFLAAVRKLARKAGYEQT